MKKSLLAIATIATLATSVQATSFKYISMDFDGKSGKGFSIGGTKLWNIGEPKGFTLGFGIDFGYVFFDEEISSDNDSMQDIAANFVVDYEFDNGLNTRVNMGYGMAKFGEKSYLSGMQYGVGAGYNFNEKWSIQTDYIIGNDHSMQVDGFDGGSIDKSYITIGINYNN